MDAFATIPRAEREVYFQEAAAKLGLPAHVIEKDFWVCWTLKRLFALQSVRDDLLFKGGTSLSKVYSLIRRFSEDIDLSIHRVSLGFEGETDPANLSGKRSKRSDEALSKAAREKISGVIFPELETAIREQLGDEAWTLESDSTDPGGQSLAFVYPATGLTPGASAYLRPAVKIEFGARSARSIRRSWLARGTATHSPIRGDLSLDQAKCVSGFPGCRLFGPHAIFRNSWVSPSSVPPVSGRGKVSRDDKMDMPCSSLYRGLRGGTQTE